MSIEDEAVPPVSTRSSVAWSPRVLVVIPTLNEASHIETLLTGLLSELTLLPTMRIVVVDGGSSDGTPQLVEAIAQRHSALKLIHNSARIQSAAVNLAARRFGRDANILIRCDAHSTYPSDYCARLVETINRVDADAVVVSMDSIGRTCWQRAVAWVSNSPIGTGGAAHRAGRRSGFVDHGHHAAFRMEMFRNTGGYDETFTHNEDADFDCRQRAFGATIYLDSDNAIRYEPRATVRGLWRQYVSYGAGRSRTLRRHPGSVRARQLAVPLNLIVWALAVSLSPWAPILLVWPLFYFSILACASAYFAARHRSLCGLLAGPAAAVMHTAWASGFLSSLVVRRESRWRSAAVVPLWTAKDDA